MGEKAQSISRSGKVRVHDHPLDKGTLEVEEVNASKMLDVRFLFLKGQETRSGCNP